MAPVVGKKPDDLSSLDLREELRVLRDLWAVGHAMEQTSRRLQEAIGISAPQRMIIRIVGRYPGIVPGKLAQLLHVDAGTVSAAIARLEAKNLLERRRDPRDQRRMLLGLTKAGRLLDCPREDSLEGAVDRALARSTVEERDTLRRMLARFVEELSVPTIPAPRPEADVKDPV
jgi:MarR family transcriptional regulator, organic hydroperoxide resistance regulator